MDDDDGRTPDHGHPISSPCEPDGSGELKRGHNSDMKKITGQLFSHEESVNEISKP